jgi:2-oxo-3-hexenedioate decarboxylase
VADNSSSSAFIVGPWNPPTTDVATLGMVLKIDAQPVAIGVSAAILGHPMRSLVAGAALLARYGEGLRPGDVFLSGAATAAVPLRSGTVVRVQVEKLGGCGFAVAGAEKGEGP